MSDDVIGNAFDLDEWLVQGASAGSDEQAYFVATKVLHAKTREEVVAKCADLRASLDRMVAEMNPTEPTATVHTAIAILLEAVENPAAMDSSAHLEDIRTGIVLKRAGSRPVGALERLKLVTLLKAIRYLETEKLAGRG